MSRVRAMVAEHRSPSAPLVPDGDAAVRTVALSKAFGRHVALDQVDLLVPRGVGVRLPGTQRGRQEHHDPGADRPDPGDVRDGRGAGRRRDRRPRHGSRASSVNLPGDFIAYPDLTGAQYLHHLACLRGGAGAASIGPLAERLDLPLDRRIGTLSHGNRQKVGIVQAFMHHPPLLVLDEPTAGLDPMGQREFLAMVREVRDEGRTVFLSSHVLSEVEAVADLVGILRTGRLVVTDSLEDLERQAVRRIDLFFAGPPPLDEIRRVAGAREVVASGRDRSTSGSRGRPPTCCAPSRRTASTTW